MSRHEKPRADAIRSHLVPTRVPTPTGSADESRLFTQRASLGLTAPRSRGSPGAFGPAHAAEPDSAPRQPDLPGCGPGGRGFESRRSPLTSSPRAIRRPYRLPHRERSAMGFRRRLTPKLPAPHGLSVSGDASVSRSAGWCSDSTAHSGCQRPSVSPQRRPSVLPGGGHVSPRGCPAVLPATGSAPVVAAPSPSGEAERRSARCARSGEGPHPLAGGRLGEPVAVGAVGEQDVRVVE
jgi:hypothetical protein